MSGIERPTFTQALAILDEPRKIPGDIVEQTVQMLNDGVPIVDVDQYGEYIADAMSPRAVEPGKESEELLIDSATLACCSLAMTALQAGDLKLAPPRETCLHEHNQAVGYMYGKYAKPQHTDPRDALLDVMFPLQDGGKSLCVAVTGSSKQQDVYNQRVARNVLEKVPERILSADEKKVILLLISQKAIGRALRHHAEKDVQLEIAAEEALHELNTLRAECPPDFVDVFDDQLLTSYLVDASAHTGRAQYINAQDGTVRPAVTDADRAVGMTLDSLFLETGEGEHKLKLRQPKHIAVMQVLFPNHYE